MIGYRGPVIVIDVIAARRLRILELHDSPDRQRYEKCRSAGHERPEINLHDLTCRMSNGPG